MADTATTATTAATATTVSGAGGGAGAAASSTVSSGATRVVGTAQNHWVVDDNVVDVSRTKPLVVPHPITITTSVDKKLRLDVTKAALVVVDSMLFVVVSGFVVVLQCCLTNCQPFACMLYCSAKLVCW